MRQLVIIALVYLFVIGETYQLGYKHGLKNKWAPEIKAVAEPSKPEPKPEPRPETSTPEFLREWEQRELEDLNLARAASSLGYAYGNSGKSREQLRALIDHTFSPRVVVWEKGEQILRQTQPLPDRETTEKWIKP